MYNANYIVLEGNKEAMNKKKIVISIEPGTYNESKLLNTLNQSIATAATTYPEVNFGTTQVNYSSVHNKIQFQIDLIYTDPDGVVYNTPDFNLIFYKPNGESNQQSLEQNYDYEFITLECNFRVGIGI